MCALHSVFAFRMVGNFQAHCTFVCMHLIKLLLLVIRLLLPLLACLVCVCVFCATVAVNVYHDCKCGCSSERHRRSVYGICTFYRCACACVCGHSS